MRAKMRVELDADPEGPFLVLIFSEDSRASAVEENVELIVSDAGKLIAVRIWLGDIAKEYADEPVGRLAANCLRSGWRLSQTNGKPWMFYQFSPAQGGISILDWVAEVFATREEKRITGIEIWLRGAPVTLHL